jgi:hypothetical protein
MEDMKYHVVKDKDEVPQIFYGRTRSKDVKPEEAKQREIKERWIPNGWEVIDSCEDEGSAEQKLEELLKQAKQAEKEKKNGENKQ